MVIEPNKLEEKTAYLSSKFIATAKERWWYDIFITEWFRTQERQQKLYAQWRTKPWKIVTYVDWVNNLSDHQLWIAFDIAFRGDTLYPKDNKIWNNLADLATELWLKSWWKEWWRDRPHFRNDNEKQNTIDIEDIVKDVWKRYWISSDFLYCIATSETSGWKNLKSKNNRVNAWNHDSWKIKEFASVKENFEYTADKLVNWPYLSQWSKVAELSCWGRIEILWRKSCKRTEKDYYYASDIHNRHKNMQKCMEKRLGSWDYLNWSYKK